MTSQMFSAKKYFCGIDPGAKGAIAVLDEAGQVIHLQDLPTTNEEWNLLLLQTMKLPDDTYVALENVHALPNQSTVAGFTFGKNVGKAELLAEALAILDGVLLVTPQKWKKHFGLSKDKKEAIELAKVLFKDVEERLTASKDGRAEALLIAEYCRQSFLGII